MLILSCHLNKRTHFKSLSSSPKLSKYTEPQRQTLSSRITNVTEEDITKNKPVPQPQSDEC